MKKTLFFALFSIVFLASCEQGVVLKEYQDFAMLQWKDGQAAQFAFDNPTANATYELIVSIRHSAGIEFGDLMVEVKVTDPAGQSVANPYVLELRDPADGSLLGEALGDIVDINIPIEPAFAMPQVGKYQIEINQKTGQEIVNGVLEVGVILKVKP